MEDLRKPAEEIVNDIISIIDKGNPNKEIFLEDEDELIDTIYDIIIFSVFLYNKTVSFGHKIDHKGTDERTLFIMDNLYDYVSKNFSVYVAENFKVTIN